MADFYKYFRFHLLWQGFLICNPWISVSTKCPLLYFRPVKVLWIKCWTFQKPLVGREKKSFKLDGITERVEAGCTSTPSPKKEKKINSFFIIKTTAEFESSREASPAEAAKLPGLNNPSEWLKNNRQLRWWRTSPGQGVRAATQQ